MEFTLDDAVIAYDYVNNDSQQPPLLFLHGALGVRGQFGALQKAFAERAQLAIDFPSHGASIARRTSLNSEQLARDTLALLDALGIAQVDVVGHSMGGYVGLLMAHLAPARVRSVVALGTKFYWTEEAIARTYQDLDADLMRERSARQYETLAAMHPANGLDSTLRLTQSLIADFRRWRLTDEMVREAGVPVLLCAGDRDALVPAAEVARLYGALESKLNAMAILPNTPHPLQHVAVDCFERAARRFWQNAFPPA